MDNKSLLDKEQENNYEKFCKSSNGPKHFVSLDEMAVTDCVFSQSETKDHLSDQSTDESISRTQGKESNHASANMMNTSPVQFHIRILYIIVIGLTLVLIPAMITAYLQIISLRETLSHRLSTEDVVNFRLSGTTFPDADPQMPYIPAEDELNLGGFWEGDEQLTTDTTSSKRTKRHTTVYEGSGAADDWLWMTSYARVPVSIRKVTELRVCHEMLYERCFSARIENSQMNLSQVYIICTAKLKNVQTVNIFFIRNKRQK